ncbi:hypothetical protein O1M63_43695 [Streptomyces mirabilis]|nr:hypothetical protein [Streptomyces mirabilis]
MIAAGALAALDHARTAVLAAQLRKDGDPADTPTATADCHDADASPGPTPAGAAGRRSCCVWAAPTPASTPAIIRGSPIWAALSHLRSVLPAPVWHREWADHYERLEDLWRRLGAGRQRTALAQVTDTDRALIDLLLNGALNP